MPEPSTWALYRGGRPDGDRPWRRRAARAGVPPGGLQERLKVGERELRRHGVARLEYPRQEGALLVLERQHLLLDRLRADELVARHDAGLANAVGPVRRLGLGRRIPPGVKVHDRVGPGEIQAGAARLQREQEHGDLRGTLEAVDLGLPGRGGHGAVQVAVGDALGNELLPEKREERGELGEHEQAMAVVLGLLQDFPEGFELGGASKEAPRLPPRRSPGPRASGRSRSAGAEAAGSGRPGAARASPAPGGLEVKELAFRLLLEGPVERGLGGL